MRFRTLLVLVLALMPAVAFGQSAKEKYQQARAAEFKSDHETGPNRVNEIGSAFQLMADAAIADRQYTAAFAEITLKMLARYTASISDSYDASRFIEVGKKRGSDPAFKKAATEYAAGYKKFLLGKGFAPSKPFLQIRERSVRRSRAWSRSYCSVPEQAEQIFELSRFVGSVDTRSWGKYSADTYMHTLRGCAGEGGDYDPQPFKAFPIYVVIMDQQGMHKAGKMAGDQRMRDYIYGEYDEESSPHVYRDPGYRPFYDKAMGFYHTGGVSKTEIRQTLLRIEREATTNKNTKAVDLIEKTLAGTF